jgi:hypothetical protein
VRRATALAIAVGAASLSTGRAVHADTVDWRYGFTPMVGTGFAFVTHAAPLPSFVGLTSLGGDFILEWPPWGGFLHGEYISSGNAGRWQALSFAVGGSRRLAGAAGHVSLVGRGGIAYEHWWGNTGGSSTCEVLYFVPNSCDNQPAPAMMGTITATTPFTSFAGDALGILAGLRLEIPILPVYVAIDASFVPTFDVDSSAPTAIIGFRLDLVLGFLDRRPSNGMPDQRTTPHDHFRRGT